MRENPRLRGIKRLYVCQNCGSVQGKPQVKRRQFLLVAGAMALGAGHAASAAERVVTVYKDPG
jgi:hypothetical protein